MKLSFVLSCVVVLSGCGIFGGKNAKCDLRPKRNQCTDWRGVNPATAATLEGLCANISLGIGGAQFADGTCDSANSLGGCQATLGDGSKQTNWKYKSENMLDAEEVKSSCPDEFVPAQR